MRQKDSTSNTRSNNKNDGENKKKIHSFWSTLRQSRKVSTAGTKQKSSSTTITLGIVSQLEKNAAKTEAVRRNSTSTYTSRDATRSRSPNRQSKITVTTNLPRRRRSISVDRSSTSIERRDSRSTSADRKQRGHQSSRDRQQDDNLKTNGITSITRSGRSRSSRAATSDNRSRSTIHDRQQRRERSTSRDTNKSTGNRQRSSSGNSKRRSNSSSSQKKTTRNTKQTPKSTALPTTMHHICDFKFTDIIEMITLDWDDTEDTQEKKLPAIQQNKQESKQQNKQQQQQLSVFGSVALCGAMTAAAIASTTSKTTKTATQSSTTSTATTTVTPSTTTITTATTTAAASTATRALPGPTNSVPVATTSTAVKTIYDPSAVTVAVEAAVIWKKRELDYMIESDITPVLQDEKGILLSSNVVGFTRDCNPSCKEYGIEKGERVGSIMPWVGRINNPNIPIPVKYLVPVPRNFDSCDIVCILSYYLPAFETLHHGRIDDGRYSRTRFIGNRILINACNSICITPMIKAIIKLSKYAGCTEVYVVAPLQEHVEIRHLDIVMVLDDDHPDHWLPVVKGQMDLVIDFSFPNEFHYIRKALNPKGGRIVCYPSWGHQINSHLLPNNDKKSELTYFYEYCQLATMKHASIFDFNQHLDTYRDEVMDDINFLFHMLDLRQVRPEFVRYNNIQTVIKHATQNIAIQVLNENNKRIDNEQEGGGNRGGAIIYEPTRTSLKTINIDYGKNL